MADFLLYLSGAAVAVTSLGVLWKKVVKPAINAAQFIGEQLDTIQTHTKQLTGNGGEHLADVVRRTETKVDGFDHKWVERQTALDNALREQQEKVASVLAEQETKVAAELKDHRGETAREFSKVWQEIATRDIHKSADQLNEAADRAAQTIKEKQ